MAVRSARLYAPPHEVAARERLVDRLEWLAIALIGVGVLLPSAPHLERAADVPILPQACFAGSVCA